MTAPDAEALAALLRQATSALDAVAASGAGPAAEIAAAALRAIRGGAPLPPGADAPGWVAIDYTNHAGRRDDRLVLPTGRLLRGPSPWHPRSPWLLEAFDRDKGATRHFDPSDVHAWEPAPAP